MDKKFDYKNIFVVDPVRGERIAMAKFIMQVNFTVMTFVSLADCFKKKNHIPINLIIMVLRRGKTELKNIFNIKHKYKNLHFLFLITPDVPDVNLAELREKGFPNVHKANSMEKVREITYELLAPDGLAVREETPHPVPLP